MTQKEFDLFCRDVDKDLICYYEAEGSYVLVNNAALAITGYSPAELIGKNHYDFFHPEDRKYIQNAARYLSLQGKQNKLKPLRFRKKDGAYVWLSWDTIPVKDENENVTNLLSISRNIGPNTVSNDEKLKKEALYDEIGKMAGIGYWELDLQTMAPTWSKASYDIHELDYIYRPDLNTAVNFFAKEARITVLNAINDAIYNGKSFDLTEPLVTAKGRKTWVRILGKPVVENDKTVQLLGLFQDVSKKTEELNYLKGEVKLLSSKNSQLEEFNDMLSHNVRSPIASLSMLLSLYEIAADEHEKEELFDALKMASKSMNDLLDEMMDSVKAVSNREVESEENDLMAVINQTTELLKGDILKSRATIKLELRGWERIYYPRMYMESIILNLMSNALKYRSDDRDPVITIQTKMVDGCKVMVFSDNGSGIDMERYADKVFKLYRVFHRSKPGKGLGLFMIKGHVEAMGGEITINSELDKGTTFVIIFDKYKKLITPL